MPSAPSSSSSSSPAVLTLRSVFSHLWSLKGLAVVSASALFLTQVYNLVYGAKSLGRRKKASGKSQCPFGFKRAVDAGRDRGDSTASSQADTQAEAEAQAAMTADDSHSFSKSSAPPLPVRAEALDVWFSLTDLAHCKGEGGDATNKQGFKKDQILICVNGEVYEASSIPQGAEFYGPGKHYSLFAGVDSSVALATMKLETEALNKFDLSALGDKEKKTLAEWVSKFRGKYAFVGRLEDLRGKSLDLTEFGCKPIEVLPKAGQ